MTEHDPENIAAESSEGDFVDQHTDVDDFDIDLDTDELVDDSWDADLTDVADQHTPAPLDEDDP